MSDIVLKVLINKSEFDRLLRESKEGKRNSVPTSSHKTLDVEQQEPQDLNQIGHGSESVVGEIEFDESSVEPDSHDDVRLESSELEPEAENVLNCDNEDHFGSLQKRQMVEGPTTSTLNPDPPTTLSSDVILHNVWKKYLPKECCWSTKSL